MSPFGLSGKSGRAHKGTDYAGKGASVLAAADGAISKIGWDLKKIAHPDPRTALSTTGWGRYIVITHSDGSETLYAHMEKDSTAALAVGKAVKRGQPIGKSDSTGAVTGPHLHFEYAPLGKVIRTALKADPDRCIEREGSVTLFSAMKLQGGVFRLSLDGREIGRVAIGERRAFPVSGFLPGKIYVLRLEALEAQLGSTASYGIELSGGLAFLNGKGEEMGAGQYAELSKGTKINLPLAVKTHY